jgi:hypothetical protein
MKPGSSTNPKGDTPPLTTRRPRSRTTNPRAIRTVRFTAIGSLAGFSEKLNATTQGRKGAKKKKIVTWR